MKLRVTALRWACEGVLSLELQPLVPGELPAFEPGAHLDLVLPNGMTRSYSLCGAPEDRGRYVVAVGRDRASRGGSAFVHEKLRPGDVVEVAGPRNNFPLVEDAPHSLLVAGGIGITPLLCMAQRLEALGRPWTLHYAVRNRAGAAFLDVLTAARHGTLKLHVDEEAGGVLDLGGVVAAAPAGAHLYCCGPAPMLRAFETATAGLPPERVHVEWFTAKEAPAAEGGFVVRLARSGREIAVPRGRTILETLEEAGLAPVHSCRSGVCGACETKVLEGTPEHRDGILTEAERKAGTAMMICCSGSRGKLLVLDL